MEDVIRWSGVLLYVDTPSDFSPGDCSGRKLIVTRKCVENTIPQIIGSWVGWRHSRHPAHAVWGKVDSAELVGDALTLGGWAKMGIASIALAASKPKLGMSLECLNVSVRTSTEGIWVVHTIDEFHGVAVTPNPCFKSHFEWQLPKE